MSGTKCAWCDEAIRRVLGTWMHRNDRRVCVRQVGPAAFVRGVTFFATPSYGIDVPFPDA